jgi:pyruvate/2-oxoglutarate dehydrogenase complex dihydrolipoamide acyltransferase (E2) component
MQPTPMADHRLVDGKRTARFANAVQRRPEDTQGFEAELLDG